MIPRAYPLGKLALEAVLEGIADLATVMPEALDRGQVDAVATWNPLLTQLKRRLGAKGRIFCGEDLCTETFNAAGRKDFVTTHPAEIRKLLSVLLKAEKFVEDDAEAPRRLDAEFVKIDQDLLDDAWDDGTYRVSLDQFLIVDLEHETRWAMGRNLAPCGPMPDCLDVCYLDGLRAVKPVDVHGFIDAVHGPGISWAMTNTSPPETGG